LKAAMLRRRHTLPFGAELVPGEVRFRLWAPRASSVALQFADVVLPMVGEPEGWFALTTDRAGPGALYRYVVDGNAYPDPASRRQPDGVHGPSEVVDPMAYSWTESGWRGRPWEEIVLYEIHLGSFSQTGDFAGAMRHLDHVRKLGATAVELMPIAEFPGTRGWGYDGTYLYAPSSRYGRPEDLKRLVEACHARGLAVFLDVVYNHFGPEGNYLRAIAPEFFTERHHTPWGSALDFAGPHSRPVRDFMIHNALFWLEEYDFDGLRLDAVHAIHDGSEPDILAEIARTARRRITDREIHLVLENDRNEARYLERTAGRPGSYTAQWNDDLHHALHVLITDEDVGYYADYAAQPAAYLGRALAEGFAYQGEASPFRGGRRRGEPSAALAATAFVAFLQNHDQIGNQPFGTRLSARTAEPLLHAAVAIVLLSPQIPLLFMGEEWASARPFLFFCDFGPSLADAVREGRRREFAHFPEFRDEAARQRIPDPTFLSSFEMSCLDWAELRRKDHARWLARCRRLLAIRQNEIVPRLRDMAGFAGSYRVLGAKGVVVEWRLGDGSRLRLVANFASEPIPPRDIGKGGRILYASGKTPGAPESAAFVLLPP
jgi:malto-oligosyltrehalose trehalohydrolase